MTLATLYLGNLPDPGHSAVGCVLRARLPLISVYVASAALSGIIAFFFVVRRPPQLMHERSVRSGAWLIHQPLVLLVTAALFIYVGTEIGVSSWSSVYVVKVLGVSASSAAFIVSLFWLGLFTGRLGISCYRGDRQELLMLVLSVLSAVALVNVLLLRSTAAVASAVFAAGLGCSGFYPLGMSLLGRHFRSGIAVGTAATGGAAGSIAFPFLMALISQRVGVRDGFWFYFDMNIVLVILTVLLIHAVGHGKPKRTQRGANVSQT